MLHILSPESGQELSRFARGDVLLAFDFDGTLAPIVSDPERARLRPATQALFDQVTRRYTCAVISGRAKRDALDRLGRVQLWEAIGNHGADLRAAPESYEQRVKVWRGLLEARLRGHPGVVIEDKGISLSVHYRNAADPQSALAAIYDVTSQLERARVFGGKKVINVLPDDAPHKGTALDCMRRWAGCDLAIYIGDDVTDEDAFALPPETVLSIRVGESASSRARYFVHDQHEMDGLLERLLSLRPQSGS